MVESDDNSRSNQTIDDNMTKNPYLDPHLFYQDLLYLVSCERLVGEGAVVVVVVTTVASVLPGLL